MIDLQSKLVETEPLIHIEMKIDQDTAARLASAIDENLDWAALDLIDALSALHAALTYYRVAAP